MILLPYRFCGDSHHAFAFPFVLIFLPLRLSCKESSTSNQAFLLRRKDVTALSAISAPPVPPQREGPYPIPKPKIPTIGIRDVTALRCSKPLRYKVGGPSKVSPYYAGWDRLGINYYGKATSQLQRRHCSIPSLLKSLVVSFFLFL